MKANIRIHQMGVSRLNVKKNVNFICASIEKNAGSSNILLFPECALNGYDLNVTETHSSALSLDSAHVKRILDATRGQQLTVVFGMLERDGNDVYNSAVIIQSGFIIQVYRKIHLPYMGVDKFVVAGERIEAPFEVNGVRFGVGICYDYRFPEFCRTHALRGADCMLLITNWPVGSAQGAEILCPAHALASKFYFVACNRVGVEGETQFLGRSAAYDPTGRRIAYLKKFKADTGVVEIDSELARHKEYAEKPGMLTDVIGDRKPQVYNQLTAVDGRPNCRTIQELRNLSTKLFQKPHIQ